MKRRLIFEGDNRYYHVFNRGVEKRDIFMDDQDRRRFLFSLLALQGDVYLNNFYRLARTFDEHSMFIMEEIEDDIMKSRVVEIVSFALMPNHFHLILNELTDGGIAKFMQRLGNSYTKCFNLKYQRNGHLFGSRFHRKLIDTNEYFLHLSAYIHRNPRELRGWRNKEHKYPWSSYQDYIEFNRWGKFINPSIILDQFSDKKEYGHFVQTSNTKIEEEFIGYDEH